MYRFWNDMCICKTSIVIRTSGNLAAILDFEHTSTSHEIESTTTRKSEPGNRQRVVVVHAVRVRLPTINEIEGLALSQ